jgi:hypothetical protein
MGSNFGPRSEPYHIIGWELCCASRQKSAATSQKDQKQTLRSEIAMSALPPKADIACGQLDVRFVPILLQKSAMTSRGGLAQTF